MNEFIKSLLQDLSLADYDFYLSHPSMDNVITVVNSNSGFGQLTQRATPIKFNESDSFIRFLSYQNEIVIDWIALETPEGFDIYEMNMKTYNELERKISLKLNELTSI